jgi:hypothetical protein
MVLPSKGDTIRLPIDTTSIKFAAAGPAEPVIDFATKAAKVDDNGVPVYTVPVFMAGSGIKDSISIKVSGEVKGLSEFTLVKITNLIAQTWEVGTNHGVSFKADRIDVAKAPA